MHACTAGLKAFFTTPQLTASDKAANALALGTSPIVRCVPCCTQAETHTACSAFCSQHLCNNMSCTVRSASRTADLHAMYGMALNVYTHMHTCCTSAQGSF